MTYKTLATTRRKTEIFIDQTLLPSLLPKIKILPSKIEPSFGLSGPIYRLGSLVVQ